MDTPIIGITMGDPAGCGPEITIKALFDTGAHRKYRPLVVGDARVMRAAVELLESTGYLSPGSIEVHPIQNVVEAEFRKSVIDVLHMDLVDPTSLEPGKISAVCGDAAFRSVAKVIGLALNGEVDATVTNALNKEALQLAGHRYAGHTEIYADLCGTKDYAMMLAHEDLRVVHVSTHVSLAEACRRVKKDRVLTCIRLADQACRALGILKPRVAVAGLNPHAGEDGLFGREEIEEISPAIEQACAEGICAEGPVPADTVFSKAKGGWFDIVVVMYHDQGHIPLKLEGFVYDRDRQAWKAVAGVNITLGLPIIRVSVDHGTAFGHAWQGVQNALSLTNAIDQATLMAKNRPGQHV